MEIERWKRVDELLQSALELTPERREDFLREACGGDESLAAEVRSLVTSYGKAGGFLETPAVELAARAMAAEAAPLLAASRAGQTVSVYRLLSMLGSGGMGTVWLAERCDGRFERKVAIKFIHGTLLDAGGAERFKREGAILGKLAHPQIAELIDAGLTASGEPYLALEYVEGKPIDAYCNEHKLDLEARIGLFLDVLSAVAHAHSNLVVHRDIKPSNVFIRNDAQVKLLDFGIAKVLAGGEHEGSATWLTVEGGGALTPMFAAPEQLSDGVITTMTDIYSLGVLLYLLLTGQHPAGPGPHSPATLIKTIVDQESARASSMITSATVDAAASRATTPDKLRRQLRGDLDRIVAKAIKKDPAERYPSALAFADDLRRYLEHRPVLARPDAFGYRFAKFVRRNRVAVALAAIAFVAATAGVSWIVLQDRRIRAERDFAFHQLTRVDQHDDFLEFLLSEASPSGKPFTVIELLDRAKQMVEKQKPSPTKVDLLAWIGSDYGGEDEHAKARSMLESAYQLSRQFDDPGVRADSACSLAFELSREDDLPRADALIKEGLSELPKDTEYALNRVDCLRLGSEVSQQQGDMREALRRVESAQQILRASPFDSDEFEMTIALNLATIDSNSGKDRESLVEFERAEALMTSLGRDETETAVNLYNDWALELDQLGRPLEAEKIYRRAIDISRNNSTEDAVSPLVLTNYADLQRELNHLPQAADYAERAHRKAVQIGDELSINRSLVELAQIYRAQHDPVRAEAMLAEVEPRLHKALPPGHYAFAAIISEHAFIALEKQDPAKALVLMDQAIANIQAAIKSGSEGGFALPNLYVARSEIDLALGHGDQAEADANAALALLLPNRNAADVSSGVGRAYLALARALSSENKSVESHAAATQALHHLQGAYGADYADTQSARRLTE